MRATGFGRSLIGRGGGLEKLHLGPRGPGDLSGSRVYARSAQVGGVPPPARRLDRPARLQPVLRLTAGWDRAEQRGEQGVRERVIGVPLLGAESSPTRNGGWLWASSSASTSGCVGRDRLSTTLKPRKSVGPRRDYFRGLNARTNAWWRVEATSSSTKDGRGSGRGLPARALSQSWTSNGDRVKWTATKVRPPSTLAPGHARPAPSFA